MKAATLEKKTHVTKARHLTELIRQIQKGLRFSELETLQNSIDLPFEQLAAKLSISRSTLQRRKAIEKARAWLKHPQYGLGGAVPLDYATTETGAREVENLLGRMKYGVYS